MILFCGIPSEPPLAMAIAAAKRKGYPFAVLNQRDSHLADLRLSTRRQMVDGTLWIGGVEYPLGEFTGAYTRLMDWRQLPTKNEHTRQVYEGVSAWLELATCRVFNRAAAMATNCSKPFQTQLIAKAGFLIPPTLVTNDADEVRHFQERWPRLIYKSTSSIRSIVQELAPDASLASLRNLPTQFQAFIPGVNIRVHVVGERVFATEVSTEATDYRYAGRSNEAVQMRPLRLPAGIRSQCVALSAALNLPLCGIDLKRTPEGEYYCFEVNPSPAYSYYQDQTRQPIATALVDYLARR
jgi:glutathione synthase/RimK-type ligase-like ATP-grasp enzyme